MDAAKIKISEAQSVFTRLKNLGYVDHSKIPVRRGNYFYIPLIKKPKDIPVVQFTFQEKLAKTPKSLLAEKLSHDELALLPTAFEVVGDILILELHESLLQKKKIIGEAYLTIPHVKTVVLKQGIYEGEYRTREITVLAGEKKTLTLHTENQVKLWIDVEKTYFSARTSHERMRIAKQVKPGERVLVMFSGCGPFPIVICKHASPKEVIGVEINPEAHKLAKKNVLLNHMEQTTTVLEGDVRTIVPTLEPFDRILMPLPKTGQEFLQLALTKIRIGGIIHYYDFLQESEFNQVKTTLEEFGKVKKIVKCGQHKPYVFRVCFDLQVH